MTSDLESFARAERQFLRSELDWFKAGAKLLSASGDDITSLKSNELSARLEHATRALGGSSHA
jgi:hypothetical protein